MNREEFGNDLQAGLLENSMAQADLARALKISPNAISKWLSGKTFPSPEHWKNILMFTGVDPRMYAATGQGHLSSKISTVSGQGNAGTNTAQHNSGIAFSQAKGKAKFSINHHAGECSCLPLSDKEQLAIQLFRRAGNQALLDECIERMVKQVLDT